MIIIKVYLQRLKVDLMKGVVKYCMCVEKVFLKRLIQLWKNWGYNKASRKSAKQGCIHFS